MTLKVVKAGMQTTLQGGPYSGHRHIGMPAAGAADCLSLALANRLVGNAQDELAIEITLDSVKFEIQQPCIAALTGAAAFLRINGEDHPLHSNFDLVPEDRVEIGPASQGCRSYFAIGGKLQANSLLGGSSTYLGAGLGGHEGRALSPKDILECSQKSQKTELDQSTPAELTPTISDKFVLRVTTGPEFSSPAESARDQLFSERWTIGNRANRMGLQLEGSALQIMEGSQMPSAPVFCGTIQCPGVGQPFLLGPDAQTTGGYPRIAQVIRADRHLIGQLRTRAEVQLVPVSAERATEIYRAKLALLQPWLGSINLW